MNTSSERPPHAINRSFYSQVLIMMDKYSIHGRKPPPFDFKHVRKFAVEHFKKIQQTPSISTAPSKPPSSPPLPAFHQKRRQCTSQQLFDADQLELSTMQTKETNKENEAFLSKSFLDAKPKGKPKIDVHRDVLSQEIVIKQTRYTARDKSIVYGCRKYWSNWSFLNLFQGIIPIFQWLPKYSIRRDLISDFIAGITVAIMAIPHGMAYGILAGVAPNNGLYVGIIPVLVYMFLGTSKHISIGTFAVISIMTFKVVQTYATEDLQPGEEGYTPLQVVTATAVMAGIIHLTMGLLRLGTLSALLSEPLINGFTTAAAAHVITAQLKDVLGVTIPRHKGAFKIVKTFIDLGKEITATNLATLITCSCVMLFMITMNEFIKPCMAKRCRFPVPGELIAVIGGTIVSWLIDLNGNYGVNVVGTIPLGLPEFQIPPLELLPIVAVDSIAIAVVTYSVTMSMGLTFANKFSYEIRPNQELFAIGVGNIVGGCFSCYPLGCSLARSVIQAGTGGVTQIASLVSLSILLSTILYLGKFFKTLPRCVLAGVIIVALKPMFMQAQKVKVFSQQGKLELLTWLLTFLCVLFIDIDAGLFVGICVSLLTLYVKGVKPYYALLGTIAGGDGVYVDMHHHNNAVEVPETKIFRYTGSLNFATKQYFKKGLYESINIDCETIKKSGLANGHSSTAVTFRVLVLDFSSLGHIDIAGCRMLSDIKKEMAVIGVRLFIASPADRVYDTIVRSMGLSEGPFEVFPTLHDAVTYANACRIA